MFLRLIFYVNFLGKTRLKFKSSAHVKIVLKKDWIVKKISNVEKCWKKCQKNKNVSKVFEKIKKNQTKIDLQFVIVIEKNKKIRVERLIWWKGDIDCKSK